MRKIMQSKVLRNSSNFSRFEENDKFCNSYSVKIVYKNYKKKKKSVLNRVLKIKLKTFNRDVCMCLCLC